MNVWLLSVQMLCSEDFGPSEHTKLWLCYFGNSRLPEFHYLLICEWTMICNMSAKGAIASRDSSLPSISLLTFKMTYLFTDASEVLSRALERARIETPSSAASELVVGIDFGTTFTGVAYAHSLTGASENAGNRRRTQVEVNAIVDRVVVIKSWPMTNLQNYEKTPTMLAYDNGGVSAWGGRVRQGNPAKIEHFKLGLQEGAGGHYRRSETDGTHRTSLLGGFLDNHNWRHPDLPNKSAVDFAGDYLREIRQHVRYEVLPRHLGSEMLRNEIISYVLTVPAIWTDKAKDLTRRAAELAGIPMDRLVLITEPEAAALYCATVCRDIPLKEGDRFLICDAGGGTVVSDHRVSNRLIIRTLSHTRLSVEIHFTSRNALQAQARLVEACSSTRDLKNFFEVSSDNGRIKF